MTCLELLFVIFLFIVFYTYLGYGIVLYLLVKAKELLFGKNTVINQTEKEIDWPPLTLMIAAYNEEKVIDEKMKNCLELDYPADKFHLLWVTDGSNDRTNELLGRWNKATVVFQPNRQGKTAALNRGIQFVKTDLVVFTDANTHLNPEALKEIALQFRNPKVGCVAGEKRVSIPDKTNAASGGEGIYWKYESFLKQLDSRLYSTAGAAGELFAIRRNLFEEMPTDTLLDDFILSLRIVMKGYKIAYCATAYATESGSANIEEEEKRKVRIAAGGVQSVWRLRPLLNPFKYGIFSFQYISHRVLRWTITPLLLFALLPINLYLIFSSHFAAIYVTLGILQILFYLLGFWGYYLSQRNIKNKILFIPYYFLFMNINVLRGFKYLYKRKGGTSGAWEKAKRAE